MTSPNKTYERLRMQPRTSKQKCECVNVCEAANIELLHYIINKEGISQVETLNDAKGEGVA